MKLFAGFEPDSLARCDADLCTGTRITANPCLSRTHVENTEASELNAFAAREGFLHAVKDGIDGSLGFGPWQSGPFYNTLDKVLLDQKRYPLSCVVIHRANHR